MKITLLVLITIMMGPNAFAIESSVSPLKDLLIKFADTAKTERSRISTVTADVVRFSTISESVDFTKCTEWRALGLKSYPRKACKKLEAERTELSARSMNYDPGDALATLSMEVMTAPVPAGIDLQDIIEPIIFIGEYFKEQQFNLINFHFDMETRIVESCNRTVINFRAERSRCNVKEAERAAKAIFSTLDATESKWKTGIEALTKLIDKIQ